MSNENVKVDLPTLTILGIIFITLKLMGYINWSWWYVLIPVYVLMPFWLPITVGFLTTIIVALFGLRNRNDKR